MPQSAPSWDRTRRPKAAPNCASRARAWSARSPTSRRNTAPRSSPSRSTSCIAGAVPPAVFVKHQLVTPENVNHVYPNDRADCGRAGSDRVIARIREPRRIGELVPIRRLPISRSPQRRNASGRPPSTGITCPVVFALCVPGEQADRVGVVDRQDRPARDRALRVELGQLAAQRLGRLRLRRTAIVVFLQRHDDAIAREHRRAGDHRRRRDAVDADQRAQPDRQLADEVVDRRLADVVRPRCPPSARRRSPSWSARSTPAGSAPSGPSPLPAPARSST